MLYQYIPFILYGLAMGVFLILGVIYRLDSGKQDSSVNFSNTVNISSATTRRQFSPPADVTLAGA